MLRAPRLSRRGNLFERFFGSTITSRYLPRILFVSDAIFFNLTERNCCQSLAQPIADHADDQERGARALSRLHHGVGLVIVSSPNHACDLHVCVWRCLSGEMAGDGGWR